MKPFDLEAALRGEPVMTRDGRKVVSIEHLPEEDFWRVVVVFDNGSMRMYSETGIGIGNFSSDNLIMAPQKHEAWVNIYPSRAASWYSSEADADANCAPPKSRIGGKAHRIEWEE